MHLFPAAVTGCLAFPSAVKIRGREDKDSNSDEHRNARMGSPLTSSCHGPVQSCRDRPPCHRTGPGGSAARSGRGSATAAKYQPRSGLNPSSSVHRFPNKRRQRDRHSPAIQTPAIALRSAGSTTPVTRDRKLPSVTSHRPRWQRTVTRLLTFASHKNALRKMETHLNYLRVY